MATFQQVDDFRTECDVLAEALDPLSDQDFETETLFKRWTLHDVIAHLHIFNWAADASIHRPEDFRSFMTGLREPRAGGRSMRQITDDWFDGDRNRAVFERWRDYYPQVCERLDGVDPKLRVEWAGPSMSVRSSLTARQMETWAHGQEVFDALGRDRRETDRIKNIVVLGINTFGWTYNVRKLEVPKTMPHLRLVSPSGATWEWNETESANRVAGSALEFCQVVTQVRNIADTRLQLEGDVAKEWMGMAQCFAGPPESPPAPGSRHKEAR